jgi:peptidase M28-like protein
MSNVKCICQTTQLPNNTMTNRKYLNLVTAFLIALFTISAISVDRLKTTVAWLSDPARDGRKAGTPGARAAADYLAAQFKAAGFDVQMQDFGLNNRNVVAKSGTAERYVLIGAHYDGQGTGFPSASDNAAGVAVVLEVARELKSKSLPVSVVAIAFDAEEEGLIGSRYYSDHPIYPLDKAQAAIILDTMGRTFIDLPTWTMFVLGSENSSDLARLVQKRSGPEMLVVGSDLIGPRSDFAPFVLKHVPYLFFSHATHRDYHGPGDTPDRVNYAKLAQDANLIEQVAEDVARLQTPPQYLAQPVYPPEESAALKREMETVQKEYKDLPPAYRMMFDDFKARFATDDSREVRRVATSALLALATPRFSSFMLGFIVAPFYERAGMRDIAAAAWVEAAKWGDDSFRRDAEEKIQSLRGTK